MLFKLVSSIGTGFSYVSKKSTKKTLTKVALRKYDPIVDRYVLFNEAKLSSGKHKGKKK